MTQLAAQLGDIADRIRRWSRAVGTISASVDPAMISTVQIANLDQSPYSREPKLIVDRATVGAVAAQVSFVAVQAQPGTAVAIDALWLEGQVAAQAILIYHQLNQPAPMTAYNTSRFNMEAINQPGGTVTVGAGVQVANALMGTVNAATLPNPAGADQFCQYATPAGQFLITPVQLPQPLILFGSKPGTTPTGDLIIIATTTANQAFGATVWGREWSLLQGVGVGS